MDAIGDEYPGEELQQEKGLQTINSSNRAG